MKAIFTMLLAISIVFYLGRAYESASNRDVVEANSFKKECLENYDKMSAILEEYIDRHSDDGTCDELVDSLNKLGYYKYYHRIDSLYGTQL